MLKTSQIQHKTTLRFFDNLIFSQLLVLIQMVLGVFHWKIPSPSGAIPIKGPQEVLPRNILDMRYEAATKLERRDVDHMS